MMGSETSYRFNKWWTTHKNKHPEIFEKLYSRTKSLPIWSDFLKENGEDKFIEEVDKKSFKHYLLILEWYQDDKYFVNQIVSKLPIMNDKFKFLLDQKEKIINLNITPFEFQTILSTVKKFKTLEDMLFEKCIDDLLDIKYGKFTQKEIDDFHKFVEETDESKDWTNNRDQKKIEELEDFNEKRGQKKIKLK